MRAENENLDLQLRSGFGGDDVYGSVSGHRVHDDVGTTSVSRSINIVQKNLGAYLSIPTRNPPAVLLQLTSL